MSSGRGRFRTKLCRNFALGHCPQGDRCNYVHASPESIQSNTVAPTLQHSVSQRSHDDPHSATTYSPAWPTLSPVTNASSDQYNYSWSTSSNPGNPVASRIKYRPLSWRTTLCRHYLKNRGWCPLGDDCNYIHDLTLADFAKNDIRFANRRSSSATGGKHIERGKAGSKHSHCWAYVQGLCHVQDCQYLHPVNSKMFEAHTPCLAWPNCRRGPLCPYKHPEPYISNSPATSPTLPTVNMQPNPPLSPPETVPRGALPYHSMFYFRMPPPQHASSMSIPPSLVVQPPLPQPPVVFTNPWEGWQMPFTPTSVGYPSVAVNGPPTWPGIGVNFRVGDSPSDGRRGSLSQLGHMPTYEDPVAAAPRQIVKASYSYQPAAPEPMKPRAFSTPADDFPYVAPKEQRSGHARRISVTLKSKEDLDALGLDSSSNALGRLPWQTHHDRLARRSWAPSSSSLRAAQATPPPIAYGM